MAQASNQEQEVSYPSFAHTGQLTNVYSLRDIEIRILAALLRSDRFVLALFSYCVSSALVSVER
jgi:hypothetical protein